MSSLFVSVLKQAFKTFDQANKTAFNANFQQLKQLTDQITYRDIHLDAEALTENSFEQLNSRAPCAYVHIFENEVMSISVFILRAGYTMPLHDHPLMHGILRGIYGQLMVQSYTQQQQQPAAGGEPLTYNRLLREVPVFAEQPRLVNVDTESATLSPLERNFHEITAVNGVAAFFDILSPPYDSDIPLLGKRRCRFYKALPASAAASANVVTGQNSMLLQRIAAPASYYCDTRATPDNVIRCTVDCYAELQSAAGKA